MNAHVNPSWSDVGEEDATRVIINVGGVKHECYINTIRNFPDTRLYWIAESALKVTDRKGPAEFFYDRHSPSFENILNFCRTGKLHCPKDICGPLFEEELSFWGVNELMMQPCCWERYTEYRMYQSKHQQNESRSILEEGEEASVFTPTETNRPYNFKKRMHASVKHCMDLARFISSTKAAAIFHLIVVFMSIVTYCIETESALGAYAKLFQLLEVFYCVVFTLDFIASLACARQTKWQFVKDPLNWFDLASLLPFYLGFLLESDALGFLLVLRVFRLFRLLRFFKTCRGMLVIAETLRASGEQLMLLVFVLCVPMVFFASIIHYTEKNEKDTKFTSIPRSFWWAIITLSTVGYGDMFPSSNAGKMVGAMCATFGIVVVALPISVISNNFSFYYAYTMARQKLKNHRGKTPVNAHHILLNAMPTKKKSSPRNDRRDAIREEMMSSDMRMTSSDLHIPGINMSQQPPRPRGRRESSVTTARFAPLVESPAKTPKFFSRSRVSSTDKTQQLVGGKTERTQQSFGGKKCERSLSSVCSNPVSVSPALNLADVSVLHEEDEKPATSVLRIMDFVQTRRRCYTTINC